MELKKVAFFDTKPYDKESFERLNSGRYDIRYFETRLTAAALPLPDGCDAARLFGPAFSFNSLNNYLVPYCAI